MQYLLTLMLAAGAFLICPGQHAGDLDENFGELGKMLIDIDHLDQVEKIIAGSDRVYIIGYTTSLDSLSASDYYIAAITHEGVTDHDFGQGGILRGDFPGFSLSRVSDAELHGNYLYVTGTGCRGQADTQSIIVTRFFTNGTVDTTFGNEGFFRAKFLGPKNDAGAIAVLNDGRPLICGTTFDSNFIHKELPFFGRLTANGAPDSTFTHDGFVVWDPATGFTSTAAYAGRPGRHEAGGGLFDIAVFDDHRYFLCGYYTGSYFHGLNVVVNTDSVTSPFEANYYPIDLNTSGFYSSALVRSGQVVACAEPYNNFSPEDFILHTFTAGGDVESSLNVDFDLQQDHSREIAVDEQGRIIAVGYSRDLEHSAPGYESDFFSVAVMEVPFKMDLSFGDLGRRQYDFALDDECGARSVAPYHEYIYVAGYVNVTGDSNQSDIGIIKIHNPQRPLGSAGIPENQTCFYPNPTTSELHITGAAGATFVSIYTVDGRFLENIPLGGDNISLAHLASGIYMARLNSDTRPILHRIVVR